jgi:hypothetical protein
MTGIPPVVRYMIVCDDVLTNSQHSTKPVIVGLYFARPGWTLTRSVSEERKRRASLTLRVSVYPSRIVSFLTAWSITTSVHANQYPFRLPKLCVFLVLTDGRGQGIAKLQLIDDATDQLLVEFSHLLTWPPNPLIVAGIPWRLSDLEFPQPGMYRIEFLYDDQYLAHQTLEAR